MADCSANHDHNIPVAAVFWRSERILELLRMIQLSSSRIISRRSCHLLIAISVTSANAQMPNREDSVYLAKLAEQAERYEGE